MNTRNLLLAATIACLTLSAKLTSAAVIYNNLGPGNTFFYPASTYPVWEQLNGAYIHYAAPFTVPGSTNVPFISADLGLFLNSGPNLARIQLVTNTSGNLPSNTILETINGALTAVPSSSAIKTFVSSTNPMLTAGATYWVIASMVNGGSMATWAPNNTGTLGAALTRTPFGNGQWFNQGPTTPALRINAGVVPEPATLGLGALAALGLTLLRRQRARC